MSEPSTPAADDEGKDLPDRASARRSFFLSTSLTCAGDVHQARVRNLSAGGMMVELERAPDPEWAPGDRLTAELCNIGVVKAEIAWAAGRRYGIKFDREVDPELARKRANGPKDVTPDFLRPIIVPGRSLKYVEGLQGH